MSVKEPGFYGNTPQEKLINGLNEIISNGKIKIDKNGRATITYETKNNKIYKVGLKQNWKGEPTTNKWIITAYDDIREANKIINSNGFTKGETLPLNSAENSTPNESGERAMAQSFSPELKASYEMRDKLLKSANEVRAKLSQKGKDELDKLKESKDSKLSRDAQIMKTLENAKSNPARYEKPKKLYLDENGKVKDSIGLC